MRLRYLLVISTVFAPLAALACRCLSDEAHLARIELQGFTPGSDVFHGKVSRWVNVKEVEVQVIETFTGAGSQTSRRLVGAHGPGEICGGAFAPGEEFIYLPSERNVIGLCAKLPATKAAVGRLRAVVRRGAK